MCYRTPSVSPTLPLQYPSHLQSSSHSRLQVQLGLHLAQPLLHQQHPVLLHLNQEKNQIWISRAKISHISKSLHEMLEFFDNQNQSRTIVHTHSHPTISPHWNLNHPIPFFSQKNRRFHVEIFKCSAFLAGGSNIQKCLLPYAGAAARAATSARAARPPPSASSSVGQRSGKKIDIRDSRGNSNCLDFSVPHVTNVFHAQVNYSSIIHLEVSLRSVWINTQ